MYFPKYAKHGAYHWHFYDKNTKYRRHADRIKEWVKEKNVLDIGAGDGKITHLLGIQGVDNEPEGVRLAQEKGANVVLGDAYHLPYKDEEFEAVLMADTLEHFERPLEALGEARRVLSDCLYISTPPKRSDGKLTDKYHYFECTSDELITMVEIVGFKVEGEILVIPEEKTMYGKFRKV